MHFTVTFLISLGINLFMFLPAYLLKTDKFTDISYAVTFGIVSLYALIVGGLNMPSLLLFSMILIWAIRIGSYLLIRIKKIGKDKRFDERRGNFWKFLSFWVLQGVTVWIVLLPSILFFEKGESFIPNYAYIGIAIWAFGLLIETISDFQKYKFINNKDNKGKWIDSGLWKYSRHPNYFGEITLWLGLYLYVVYAFNPIEALYTAIGPIYIGVLIIFVSGIPLLEKNADMRWGEDKNYREYKRKTSVLIPLPNKK